MTLLIIGVGGFLGAVVRYLTYTWARVQFSTQLPAATLMINVAGCFFAGMLMVFVERGVPYHRHLLLLGLTGFLASYTTFSTFGLETVDLIRSNDIGLALINVTANLLGGLIAVIAGRALAGLA
ncbi:MAG: fluoride efflux transporter CrcB [Bdellovibrionales bacterium]